MDDEPANDDVPALSAITTHLIAHPTATMDQIARAVGCSRSTLHRRFARRTDLIAAIESAALADVLAAHDAAAVTAWFTGASRPVADEVAPYIDTLITLGPQLLFLVRVVGESVLAPPEVARLDRELEDAMVRGLERGALSPRLTATWLVESLHALVYTAWEQVDRGRLAAHDATRFVTTTWAAGSTPR